MGEPVHHVPGKRRRDRKRQGLGSGGRAGRTDHGGRGNDGGDQRAGHGCLPLREAGPVSAVGGPQASAGLSACSSGALKRVMYHHSGCPRGDLNPEMREISPIRGNFHGLSIAPGARRCQASAFRAASQAEVRAGPLGERAFPGPRPTGIPRLATGRGPSRAGRAPVAAGCGMPGRTRSRRSRSALPAEAGQAKYPPLSRPWDLRRLSDEARRSGRSGARRKPPGNVPSPPGGRSSPARPSLSSPISPCTPTRAAARNYDAAVDDLARHAGLAA